MLSRLMLLSLLLLLEAGIAYSEITYKILAPNPI